MIPDLTFGLVRVIAPDGSTGTGFVVSDDGLMVTCSHVVQSESSQRAGRPRPEAVTVVFHVDGSSHSATVVPEWWRSCDAEDVAFLRLNDPLAKAAKPLKLGAAKISRGHEFYSHGYRLANQFAQGLDAEGRIESLTTYHDKSVLQLLTNQIDHGMSGAPIFDTKTQRVVGMANFIWETTRQVDGWLAGAVPAETLKAICDTLILHPPQAIEDYLAAVGEYCANLPYLTLHDIRPPKTLDEVYVPLKARPQPRKDESKPKDEQELLEREALRLQSLSIAEVMQSHDAPHILILGEPGAGKSTLLRQMAERAWDAPQAIGLSAPHLPLLVPLRHLVAGDGSLEKRLSHALASEMSLAHELPDGYMDQWPQQTGARWLILLDALDEVPDSERARLMQWLKGQLPNLREHHVVITSRPTGYKDDFDSQTFSHYDLLPFTPEQTSEFAHRWFDDKADTFLKELDRVRTGDLRGAPLLLTIAAKVFSERGTLPERRSSLYGQFVTIWLDEARQRDQKHELSDRLWDVASFVLAQLALAMTEQPNQLSEQVLSHIAADYLSKELDFKRDEAEVNGHKVLLVLARRSGVFTQHGYTYKFIHSTFREYLAAISIVRQHHGNLGQIWARAISNWRAPNWREVSLFVLSILSNNNQDVTTPVARILWSGEDGTGEDWRVTEDLEEEWLYFVSDVLIEHVKVEGYLQREIIDWLITAAREWSSLNWDRDGPIDILGKLGDYPDAMRGLLELAYDEEVDALVRVRAAEFLNDLGHANESVQALLKLASDVQVDETATMLAIEVLIDLGRIDDLLKLAHDDQTDAAMLKDTVDALMNLGHIDDLLKLAHDDQTDTAMLEIIGDALIEQLGRADEASSILIRLASDVHVDEVTHMEAVEKLGWLGRIDDLLMLAHDPQMSDWVHLQAVETLAELGRTEEAVCILMILVSDVQINEEVRESAAETLGELDRSNDLLALARDEHMDVRMRLKVVQVLGEYADARALPVLEQIALVEPMDSMRSVALAAADRIRVRLASQSS